MLGRTSVTRLESSGWLKANAGHAAAQFGMRDSQGEIRAKQKSIRM